MLYFMKPQEALQRDFGAKTSEMLWNYCRGLDNRLVGFIQVWWSMRLTCCTFFRYSFYFCYCKWLVVLCLIGMDSSGSTCQGFFLPFSTILTVIYPHSFAALIIFYVDYNQLKKNLLYGNNNVVMSKTQLNTNHYKIQIQILQ